jgi:hypothetical protein
MVDAFRRVPDQSLEATGDDFVAVQTQRQKVTEEETEPLPLLNRLLQLLINPLDSCRSTQASRSPALGGIGGIGIGG